MTTARKMNPEDERAKRRAAAAEAVARYRANRAKLGYVAVSFWVPGFLRPQIRAMVNQFVNEQLAILEAQRTGELDVGDRDDFDSGDDGRVDRAPARPRRGGGSKPVDRRRR